MKKNNVKDIYQLSPTQQGMLFHTLYAPSSGVYCQQFSCTFTGSLDVEAFNAAWQQVVARHVVLRTAFIWEREDVPLQVVYRQVKLPLEIHSWLALSPDEQQQQLQDFLASDCQHGFQLTKAPLMRLSLIQMSEDVYHFVWSYHHILLDGWSLPLVLKEVLGYYQALSLGQELQLPPSRSYREYIAWLQKQKLEVAEQFWRQTLHGVSTPTPLGVDKPHHSKSLEQSYSEHCLTLSTPATFALVSFARQHQLTLNTLVQAAWALLLSRYSGESDVVFGVTVSGRTTAIKGVESIVGLFINTLPMRVGVSPEDTVLPKLKQIQKLQVEMSTYEYTPLVEIQQMSDMPRGLPLFESIVVFENYPVDAALQEHSQNLHVSDVRAFERNNYPLTLIAQPGVQLSLRFIYDSQRFDSATVTRMMGHFLSLLQGLVANPNQKLSCIPLLSAAEQNQILSEWNKTQANYPQDLCLHTLFEQQVQKTPNAVAVVFEDQRLTYCELNTRANQLAHYLVSLGVGPEVLVGVCLERSVSMVVGLLGILKAGGAYVPLDPEYPPERLAYMLEDSCVKVLLTQEKFVASLAHQQAHLVCLDTDWQALAHFSTENTRSGVLPHHLAYTIYTSGSTGKPKGAMNTHQGVCNRLLWMQQAYQITQRDRVLQKTPFSFDVSVWEFFWPLMTGARLVVVQPGGHRDSANLVKLIAQHQITTLHFVPSMLRVFLEEQNLESCTSLRQVFCSGEALPKELQDSFFARLGCSLHNLYGPTEAAIDVTYWQCQQDSELLSVPIGRPIANTQIYILDRYNQPVPVGVAGELHISGVGLARGYLNRPELTAEKFVPNPFVGKGERLYKTGDLVRYKADGNIEYIGRIDHQVKIRGFRIELGEIEAVLSQHPNVQQTVVIATQEMVGAQRLVAYLVANEQSAPTIGELRAFLKQKLPEYMLPSAFMVLDALPLTPNGKLDRKALPKPSWQPELDRSFVAPRTPTEERLANIWASVLGIELVGIHDNFFELGGDSILSLQIIAKANSVGIQLSAKQMFEYQTIAELATVVGTTEAITAQQGVVSGTLPLTPIQQWFFLENFSAPAHWNQAVLLEMPQGIQPHLLEQVVRELLVHHDALRLRFEKTDSGWQQINAPVDDKVPLAIVDLSTVPQAQQQVAIEAKAAQLQGSLNLSSGLLVRVAWFNLGGELNSRLLVVIHHLAVDGVSWRILLEDLQVAYSQLSAGRAIQLPAKTTSFKDWAQLQWEYVQSLDLQRQCDFWLLQSLEPVANIPLDYPSGANTEASARTVSMSLSVEETRALLQEVPKAYNTQINDVLLTALVQVLSDWTQSTHVLFNLEGHGREEILDRVNISRTVGWFTTIFPVVLQYATNTPGEALKSIKEQLRRIPQQGISYGWLRYLLDDKETIAQLTHSRPAQIVFNHLGQFDLVLQTSALFKLANESSGPSRSPLNHRSHLLEVNSIIFGSQLRLDWTYSENLHHSSTIERLAHEFLQALRGLIAHCLAPEAGGYTPSDFPLARLNDVELEQMLSNVVPRQGIGKTNWQNLADIYPLSSVQQGMLFHTLYASQSGVYCQQFSCTFTGALNVEAFNAAWQQVVARHVVLRTAFIWERQDVPLQVVYRQVKLPLEIHSWLGLSPHEQQQQLASFIEQDQHRGFQLTKAPLMRLSLIQMSEDVYQFVWSYHHILLDGWSLPLVFTEVLGYYQALSVGKELLLPPSRSYREYIAWLQKQKLETAEQFWQQTLQGVTAPTPLVVDRAHHTSKKQSYSEHFVELSTQATSALVSFARQHQLTLNTLVQAAWALLLSRYSGESDVVFGVTVSGRTTAIKGVESIVGLFINTLPMRVGVSPEDTVLPKLKQIQKLQVEMSTYEYTPLVEIQQMSDMPRGLPLFESIVVFENYPVDAALQEHSQNLHISDVRTFERTNYPLTVIAQPGVQLSLRFIYDSQRFESATVTRMMGHFLSLLQGLVANPHQKLSHLQMLSAAEQNQILSEWNNTQADYPKHLCIHELFEQQVQKTPNAVAVVFEDQRLTYSELNAKANQLAHHLQRLGVEPEVLVGLCVERSLSMVVGLLGILKAGGAYVPLDPAYPRDRLAFMLEEASVPVLLTQERLMATLPELKAQVVCLDADWQEIARESEGNSQSKVTPEHLAYVIYTSGSTGKPKGVQILHGALVNFLNSMHLTLGLSQRDILLSVTTLSFDIAGLELYLPLIVGASIVVVSREVATDGTELLKRLSSSGATVMQATPATWRLLLASGWHDSRQLKILCGGEALKRELAEQLLERCTELWNLYGPTETTIWSAAHKLETLNSASSADSIISIGRPIANTQFYVLDKHLQPVPVGVPGELHIGGVSLARGYLNRPQLTSEKFIENPFINKAGERLYKTGDLVRFKRDGNLEYLGRIDEQVKIRGFRIELGEIEALLNQHPNVRETAVIAKEDIGDDKRLVAYITPHQDLVPTMSDLRSFLKQKLPEYMLPSAFVVLDALPLTPNGKLDRKALPNPESAQPELKTTFVAPRTPTEEVLAEIWTQVLRLEQVGVDDNFFDLGGHSLTATQLVFRVRNTFKLELPLHALLETPTVAAMAEVVDNVRNCKPTATATTSVRDLNAEAVLDQTIRPEGIAFEQSAQPARIFLTGATGFLGAFLLSELLQQTDADIYCLVRSSNVEQGLKKIQANLQSYLLWNECFSSRIISVTGDLSQPLFGLDERQFQTLASTIDVIYHNGALVNFIDPYPKLKAANVLGTQEVLRLASQIKLKSLHYISTFSVFPWEEGLSKEHIFRENDSLDRGNLAGGYEQSKWVAEKLVTIARSRGLPVSIYRPGRVSGHSQTGTSNTNDLLFRMLKGCIQLGSFPDFNMVMDLTPVDYVSKCIVYLSRQKKFLGENFHVVNPHPALWSNVMTWLWSFGYSLEVISYDRWRARLLEVAEHSSDNALYPLIPFFAESAPNDLVTFDCQNTLSGLAGTSINCPSVSAELLSTYLSYYIRSGYLEAPQQKANIKFNLR
ncbi:amino acid adenylation domain-containing protein [Scytonema tolypothrichoides VB-61278_2]|uniref:Amino acid adenylation domain-containing protein n=1 Tax=Scytonema tolypothrichoides VB-61278_2 TaxID=3232314 RepID=A0ABW8WNM8_9CYAN